MGFGEAGILGIYGYVLHTVSKDEFQLLFGHILNN